MLRRTTRLLPVLALFATLAVAGCKAGPEDRTLLEAPVVGDLYAAQLSEFSDYGFTDESGKDLAPAYGLMRVTAVDEANVVVITENAASGEQAVSRQDIAGDMANIEFDDSEQIEIARTDLVQAWDDKLIYAVKRPAAAN
ncbi:hypothetical protein [Luteimonas rhizosphaerae]|uniref:hypothetical protein n=2 Tax=Luteimonas TaxID=83614 RepID=UPI000C7BC1D3|nr:hypothetical protein [Luteimonas sp. 4-12]